MTFSLSKFGDKFAAESGIQVLMDDLGQALSSDQEMMMLGGGNPAKISEVRQAFRRRMEEILYDGSAFEDMLGDYDTPQGRPRFIKSLVSFFNAEYGWGLSEKNIAITNGSQSASFCLLNMFAGDSAGSAKKILMPLMPEYIGYADQGLSENIFRSFRPKIDLLDRHTFKYRVDFDALEVADDVGAIAVSRPTNPTGNVLTDKEIRSLSEIAKRKGIPFIIDNAYGAPFPNIIFNEVTPFWEEHVVLLLSLSKLGLPGCRTGIVIASEQVIDALSKMNAILSLANGNVGQEIVNAMIRRGEIQSLCKKSITPFYRAKAEAALAWAAEAFNDELPFYFHRCEGSIFLWLWCRDLPVSSQEMYQRLKQRNVLVVPGKHFFFGLDQPWEHQDQCFRLNYSQPEAAVRQAVAIIADEVDLVYRNFDSSQKKASNK